MKTRPNVKEYIKRRDAAVLAAVRDDNIEPLENGWKNTTIKPRYGR